MTKEKLIEDLEELADEWHESVYFHQMMDQIANNCANDVYKVLDKHKNE